MSGFRITRDTGEAERWLDRDWLAVVGSICGLLLSVAGLTLYTFGAFLRPLQAAFHWSRTELSLTVSIAQFAIGFSAPLWGLLSDRIGPRMILICTTISMAVFFSLLSLLTQHLWHLYLMFLLIATFGPSPVLHSAIITRLFKRRLGLALGLALTGVGLGAAVIPSLSTSLIGWLGWRGAYLGLGVLTLVIGLPAALVITRHVHGPAVGRIDRQAVPIATSLRTRNFALTSVIFVILGIVTVGTAAHVVPMMMDRGFQPAGAAKVAGLIGFTAIFARAVTGTALDRFQPSRLLAIIALIAVSAFLLLAIDMGRNLEFLPIMMLGVVLGAEGDFLAFLTRRLFPQAVFGRLFGIMFLAFTLGGGIGPILMGLSFDHLGSYRPGLLLFAALGIIAALTALALPNTKMVEPG